MGNLGLQNIILQSFQSYLLPFHKLEDGVDLTVLKVFGWSHLPHALVFLLLLLLFPTPFPLPVANVFLKNRPPHSLNV